MTGSCRPSAGAALVLLAMAALGCSAPETVRRGKPSGSGAQGAGADGSGGSLSLPNPDLATGAANSAGGAGAGTCADATVEFDSPIPTVFVLVDRSSSMFENQFTPALNRWDATKQAILSESGALATLQDKVRFGFGTYTGNYQGCPLFESLTPALDNFEAIKAAYDTASVNIGGDTPTGEAIDQVVALVGQEAPLYIVLATDGEPDNCTNVNPQCGQDTSIAALQAAQAAGIRTFVVGIGSEIGARHLQDIANAGSGQPVTRLDLDPPQKFRDDCLTSGLVKPEAVAGAYAEQGGDEPYFVPTTPEALTQVLDDLVGEVRSCVVELEGEVLAGDADTGTVVFNGEELSYGSDWEMPEARHAARRRLRASSSRTGQDHPRYRLSVR
jgi:hypothetical protein